MGGNKEGSDRESDVLGSENGKEFE